MQPPVTSETCPRQAAPFQQGRTGALCCATARRFPRAAASALRCRRGVYSVEFAMVASALLVMVLGGVEMALHGLTSVAVENALLHASRAGSLGCLQPDGTRAGQAGQQTILAAARAAAGGLLQRDTMTLDTTVFANVAAANGNSGGARGAAGTAGQTVVYTLSYTQPYLLIGTMINRTGYTHSGTITIKNEPFSNAAASATPCP